MAARLGIQVRTQGPQSEPTMLTECAEIAEASGLDELYVVDHIAIAPDDLEGSDGRYLDPLSVLMYLAAKTDRIALCTGVLIVPFRPILPTAKVIATLQEFSGERLKLGVGVGWMEVEFQATGVDRASRGRLLDEGLEFLDRAFSSDIMSHNGAEFMFRPRPAKPPILVGGKPEHAFDRAVESADGWLPLGGRNPDKFAAPVQELRKRFADAGRGEPEVAVFTSLPYEDPATLEALIADWTGIGMTTIIHGGVRYADAAEFRDAAEAIAASR
jgi:probable F420-dependent oxidoreductase